MCLCTCICAIFGCMIKHGGPGIISHMCDVKGRKVVERTYMKLCFFILNYFAICRYVMLAWEQIPGSPRLFVLQATESWPGLEQGYTLDCFTWRSEWWNMYCSNDVFTAYVFLSCSHDWIHATTECCAALSEEGRTTTYVQLTLYRDLESLSLDRERPQVFVL